MAAKKPLTPEQKERARKYQAEYYQRHKTEIQARRAVGDTPRTYVKGKVKVRKYDQVSGLKFSLYITEARRQKVLKVLSENGTQCDNEDVTKYVKGVVYKHIDEIDS